MEKRSWVYIISPNQFEMYCSKCGGDNITWSEYESCIWCYDCEIDDPSTGGIFDGPIPVNLSLMMGLHFDRINLETNKIEVFNFVDNIYTPYDKLLKELDSFKVAKEMLNGYIGYVADLKNKYGLTIIQRLFRYEESMNDA